MLMSSLSTSKKRKHSSVQMNDNNNNNNSSSNVKVKVNNNNNNNNNDNNDNLLKFNPVSKYEEGVVVPYLTLYDIERKPRELKAKSTRRSVTICKHKQPLNHLNTLFHCPVCLGYMKKTFIVMECLHRFCGECIQKCLRLGKKECPSCRVHIPSRRSLRPDLNYDAVMKKLFGDIEKLEMNEMKEIEIWNRRNNMNNAYTERRTLEIEKQAKLRKKPARKSPVLTLIGSANANANGNVDDVHGSPSATAAAASAATSAAPRFVCRRGRRNTPQPNIKVIKGGIRNLSESNLIDFVLRIHPQEKGVKRLHRECIRTSGDITIEHLKKFLGKKLSYEPYYAFQIITTMFSGKQIVLDDDISLNEVRDEIADRRDGTVMMLQYRRRTEQY